jgi:polysaccharide pyruvyl transferase WcaK-like protein
MNRIAALRAYARQRGFKVVIPSSADECIQFYDHVDLHVGSRLHAHLLFLSRNKRSYLVPVDHRSVGIAEHLGFPLLAPEALDRSWDCDFEIVRAKARATYAAICEQSWSHTMSSEPDRESDISVNQWMH